MIARPWLEARLDDNKIRRHSKKMTILSDNDWFIRAESEQVMKSYGAKRSDARYGAFDDERA